VNCYNFYSLTATKYECPERVHNQDWRKFNSWEEAIDEFGPYMRRRYLDQGLDTIVKIGAIYCPGCDNWIPNVTTYFNEITKKCSIFSPLVSVTGQGAKIVERARYYVKLAQECLKNPPRRIYCSEGGSKSKNRIPCAAYCQDTNKRRGQDSNKDGVPDFFDCSGFVSRVYMDLGLLSRSLDTCGLATSGEFIHVHPSKIQQGDIILSGNQDDYDNCGKKIANYRHAVIYVGGKIVIQSGGKCPVLSKKTDEYSVVCEMPQPWNTSRLYAVLRSKKLSQ
jgi:hypothetical protein